MPKLRQDAPIETVGGKAIALKRLVKHFKQCIPKAASDPRRILRPWGSYKTIQNGEGYQVKHLIVLPGEKLSLQMHRHRAEHWVVIAGTARMTCNEIVRTVTTNESFYVPCGSVHSIENPARIPLEIIEVQTGSYLGEDDIVRFEDRYGRIKGRHNQDISGHRQEIS